jgi:predicted metal-dependent hydrolase
MTRRDHLTETSPAKPGGWHPNYLGYFECFNSRRFFEAHDVLEVLWLDVRREPVGDFYKALIQLAGAFVHLQKRRPGPAVALLRLSRTRLAPYPRVHEGLNLAEVRGLIADWEGWVLAHPAPDPAGIPWPQLAGPTGEPTRRGPCPSR